MPTEKVQANLSIQVRFGFSKSVANPATAATMPPMSIHTALSVGDPVKNLDTSELNELVAFTPMTMRTRPPATRARERILFIIVCEGRWVRCRRAKAGLGAGSRGSAPGKEIDQHHDQRHHQQEMDDSAHRVTGYDAEEPEENQDDCDCV